MIVHLILNAHIDPVWLWPWQAGLDEALATCRSACDRLDQHPDVVFSRGEAWIYQQVERLDPALFARIRKHVEAGRWEIVGGWWIQPDCNLPSGFGFERQIELGKRYFIDTFGTFPRIAYNVDSFGHAATLPGYMRAFGQDSYIMMRPREHEMKLLARLFRWRGYEGGPEVTVFRIAAGYMHRNGPINPDHFRAALTELPAGIEHTMCFVGVGDHGGGPTEEQIASCREQVNSIPGCELVFSSPARFFKAISANLDSLPLVTGELQMHAMGCYTVHRPIKLGVRRAEHLLRQAEIMNPPGVNLDEAWKHVCFNHFHDTLGGTCLPSAYPQVEAQLSAALATADEAIHFELRRRLVALPDALLQRVILHNASDDAFEGYAEIEPWLEWHAWQPEWRLIDEDGSAIPFQNVQPEALLNNVSRLLFKTSVPAGQQRIVRIEKNGYAAPAAQVSAGDDAILTQEGIVCGPDSLDFPDAPSLPLPQLVLIADTSDTWGHGIDRFTGDCMATAQWEKPQVIDHGPLMASMTRSGRIGESRLHSEWRVYAGEQFVELRLDVHWLEKHRVLKMTLPFPAAFQTRIDGIPGGSLQRANDGRELPLRDWMLLSSGNAQLGIVCPEVYGADATPERVRFTLLRSPIMAHHDPHPGTAARSVISDQGTHTFRFRFFRGNAVDREILEHHGLMLQRPLVTAELTRGMPPH